MIEDPVLLKLHILFGVKRILFVLIIRTQKVGFLNVAVLVFIIFSCSVPYYKSLLSHKKEARDFINSYVYTFTDFTSY